LEIKNPYKANQNLFSISVLRFPVSVILNEPTLVSALRWGLTLSVSRKAERPKYCASITLRRYRNEKAKIFAHNYAADRMRRDDVARTSYYGGLRGAVLDQNGGAVAGSKVTLMDEGAGMKRATLSITRAG